MKEAVLRPVTTSDLLDVARIHLAVFPENIYSRLGDMVVARYFDYQMETRGSVLANGVFDRASGVLLGYGFGGEFGSPPGSFTRDHKFLIVARLALKPWLIAHPHFRNGVRRNAKRPGDAVYDQSPVDAGGRRDTRRYEIYSLAVDPQVQNSGLGKLLMRDQESFALTMGYEEIWLRAPIDNRNTIAFYERIGFEKVSVPGQAETGQMAKSIA